jgi:hypothetical protein
LSRQFSTTASPEAAALISLLFLSRSYDFRYPPDLTVLKPDFDAPGMKRCAGKQILYNSPGAVAAALVFLEDNIHLQARVYITSVLSVHPLFFFLNYTQCQQVAAPLAVSLFYGYKDRPSALSSQREGGGHKKRRTNRYTFFNTTNKQTILSGLRHRANPNLKLQVKLFTVVF